MKNYEKIRQKLIEHSLDAVYVTSPINRAYASGFFSTDGLAVITPDNQYFFTDSRYIEAAEAAMPDFTVEMVTQENSYTDCMNRLINKHSLSVVGFEEERASFRQYNAMTKAFQVKFAAAQGIFEELRAVKSPEEVQKLISAQRLAEEAFRQTLGVLKAGMTEKEAAAELVYRMLRLGADGLSFEPIVVSGVRSSMPHGVPTTEKIEPGTFLTMDFGCIKDGYCSDMTRTVAVGGYTDEMEKVYNVVLKAQKAGIDAARAGIPGCEVHMAAANVIAEAGYGEYFGHGFGHGIGMEVHEGNGASQSEKRLLRAGNVISAEPGIYMPGKFGVRIEDVLVIEEGGRTDITKTPKELMVI
ncbi:MAG: aminopeptidase P family protein [Oscillospiraceae bacterium]|nr:aminopeptidase P family protein [Oscillospiraceae bacterium]